MRCPAAPLLAIEPVAMPISVRRRSRRWLTSANAARAIAAIRAAASCCRWLSSRSGRAPPRRHALQAFRMSLGRRRYPRSGAVDCRRFAGSRCRCSISPARTAPEIWPATCRRGRFGAHRRGLSRHEADTSSCRMHARAEQGHVDGVLHFSRRSVEAYLDCGRGMAASRAPAGALLPVGAHGRAAASPPDSRMSGFRRNPMRRGLLALVAPQADAKSDSNRLEWRYGR